MSINILVDRLLYEEEGTTLDFKSEQYKFAGASDDDKSELLKDVISFANAWRRTDAYIVVGVKEIKGGKSLVIGTDEILDDAHLQQFINSKTNKPIEFSYRTIEFEGKHVGIFEIPVQVRPFYLKRNFGKLEQNIVYIRRGSSTAKASLDEISTMGADIKEGMSRAPVLEGFLQYGEHDEFKEKNVVCNTENLILPDESNIPDYGARRQSLGGNYSIPSMDFDNNYDYYRDRAKYLKFLSKLEEFKLCITNSGNATARDVKALLEIEGGKTEIFVYDAGDLPSAPNKSRINLLSHFQRNSGNPDVMVKKTINGWQITCTVGKIQSQETVSTTRRFYIGTVQSRDIVVSVKIYSDDLPAPITEIFKLSFNVSDRNISVEGIVPSKG